MVDYASMGKRIRKIRKDRNLTQEQLAEKVGISPTFLSMVENGTKTGSFDTYVNITIALDTTLDYLSQDIIPTAGINEQDRELLNNFHSLSPKQKQFILNVIQNVNQYL